MKRLVALIVSLASGLITLWLWTKLDRRFLEKFESTWTLNDWQSTETTMLANGFVTAFFFIWAIYPDTRQQEKVPCAFDHISLSLLAVNLLLMAASVFLLLNHPDVLLATLSELGFVAVVQETMILIAVILLGLSAVNAGKSTLPSIFGVPATLIVAVMTAAVALLYLEEISWGQHYFGWGTPQAFENNVQDETNIHNFYTNRFELLYYSAAFLAFVIAPVFASGKLLPLSEAVRSYIPPLAFAIAAAPITTMMFQGWSIILFEMYFLCAVMVGVCAAAHATGFHRIACLVQVAAMNVTQVFILANTSNFASGYEISEMRETAIAATLLAYAIWLFSRTRTNADASPD